MSKLIAAVFKDYHDAEKASLEISELGYNIEKMSIIRKGEENKLKEDSASDGAVEGGIIGGTLGLLLSIGMIAVPGLGMFAAAGPLAGILSGALAGGLIGALVDLGIPEEDSRNYEEDIKGGNILWSMPVSERQPTKKIEDILNKMHVIRIKIYE